MSADERAHRLAARIEANHGVREGIARIAAANDITEDAVVGVLVSLARAGLEPAFIVEAIYAADTGNGPENE